MWSIPTIYFNTKLKTQKWNKIKSSKTNKLPFKVKRSKFTQFILNYEIS